MANPTRFEKLGADVGRIVALKNREYGDSAGRVDRAMAVLSQGGDAVPDDVLLMVRVLDKLCRLCGPGLTPGARQDAWLDIAGYGLLGLDRATGERE